MIDFIEGMGERRVYSHVYDTYHKPGNKTRTTDDDRAWAAQRAVAQFDGSFLTEGLKEIRDRAVVWGLGALAAGAALAVIHFTGGGEQ